MWRLNNTLNTDSIEKIWIAQMNFYRDSVALFSNPQQ